MLLTETGLSDIIPGRIRTATSKSAIAMLRARLWLQMCSTEHFCALAKDTTLPTRVLDVGSYNTTQKVYLLEPSGMTGRYIALSHCWGKSPRVTTTKATLDAHKQGIDLANLPATFQDAVKITRQFDIRYLWIDSLCITQDDEKDWEREAAQMGKIYANSYLTIAADSSTDDAAGCFTPREDRCRVVHISSDNLSLGTGCLANATPLIDYQPGASSSSILSQQDIAYFDFSSGDKKSRLYISEEWMPSSMKNEPKTYKIGEYGKAFDPLEMEPLATRAWTLQERLLAPRTVHYTKNQMYWECQECIIPEDGANFPRMFPTMREILGTTVLAVGARLEGQRRLDIDEKTSTPQSKWLGRAAMLTPESPKYGRWGDAWLDLVQRYCQRHLTLAKDKLPALSGVAREIASWVGDIYHAGLWRSQILMGLNWGVYVFEILHFCDNPEHDRQIAKTNPPEKETAIYPASYRAPSWSWAALDGRIHFKPLDLNKLVAECLECYTPPAGDDAFGMLREGAFIKLKVRDSFFWGGGGGGDFNSADVNNPLNKILFFRHL